MKDEQQPASPKPVKLKADGTPDGRGHAEGSKASRFGENDGRPRRGRRKGAVGLKTAYARAAALPVEIADKNGKKRKASTCEAIALRQREKALKGDEKATKRFEERMAEFFPEPVDPESTARLMQEDEELLARSLARAARAHPKPQGSDE